jgi:hypothetical protein
VRKGYDPAAVDAHLQRVARGVNELRHQADSAGGDEALELVLRATRRSVDEALSEARAKAEQILDAAAGRGASTIATADAEAMRIRTEARDAVAGTVEEAEARAAKVTAEADAHAAALAAAAAQTARQASDEVRERYSELGQLIEVREIELAGLDDEIERRQDALRVAGSELLSLADGFVDLRDGVGGLHPDDADDDTDVSDLGKGNPLSESAVLETPDAEHQPAHGVVPAEPSPPLDITLSDAPRY